MHSGQTLNFESLWKIVTGEEVTPTGTEQSKFAARRDRALAGHFTPVSQSSMIQLTLLLFGY